MARDIAYTRQICRKMGLTFINKYLLLHVCLRYILSDNGTECKNTLMDQVLKQLCIEWIFTALYHPQSNSKLEVFYKYLKPTLKKLCEKDPSNWDQYLNQVLTSYRVTPNLTTVETPFFLVYGRDPNLAAILRRSRFWNAELGSPQACISHC